MEEGGAAAAVQPAVRLLDSWRAAATSAAASSASSAGTSTAAVSSSAGTAGGGFSAGSSEVAASQAHGGPDAAGSVSALPPRLPLSRLLAADEISAAALETPTQPATMAACIAAADPHWPAGIGEWDRVLGGGIVPGSLILLGGAPGVGKSTLLLQVGNALAQQGRRVLYVSGEESAGQVGARARRLGTASPTFFLMNQTSLELVFEAVGKLNPDLVLVDSMQTVFDPQVPAAPGSVTQVRQVATDFLALAKSGGPAVILVGHVTKSGLLAGPKLVEHIVDVVLSFEGDDRSAYRTLRAHKNRFGSTQELGIFEMVEQGLKPVSDPSASFLAERPHQVPGSVVLAAMDGQRPLLVEVQALATTAPFGGTPRRLISGIDARRVSMVLAVLEKRAGLALATFDVYVNVAGGISVDEPAADLAVAMAVASSLRGLPVPDDLAVAGEVGLAGEVRSVHQAERRVAEAARAGLHRCLLPTGNLRLLAARADVDCVGIRRLDEALSWITR